MKELIASSGGMIGFTVLCALSLNFVLSGLSKALETIKDKTATQADNKAFEIISKISAVLQKVVDWGSANRPH